MPIDPTGIIKELKCPGSVFGNWYLHEACQQHHFLQATPMRPKKVNGFGKKGGQMGKLSLTYYYYYFNRDHCINTYFLPGITLIKPSHYLAPALLLPHTIVIRYDCTSTWYQSLLGMETKALANAPPQIYQAQNLTTLHLICIGICSTISNQTYAPP